MTHYYSKEQDSKLVIEKIKVSVLGNELQFETGSGVFSKGRLDKGTEVLLNHMKIKDKMRILDLGCGYGVVGISIKKNFDVEIVMTDVNSRAVRLSKKNAKLNDVDVEILQGDSFEKINGNFDSILLNPPQHAGKKICFNMIEKSKDFLVDGGILQMVARHQKGGKHLSEKMEEVFGNLEILGIKSGFRVYAAIK